MIVKITNRNEEITNPLYKLLAYAAVYACLVVIISLIIFVVLPLIGVALISAIAIPLLIVVFLFTALVVYIYGSLIVAFIKSIISTRSAANSSVNIGSSEHSHIHNKSLK